MKNCKNCKFWDSDYPYPEGIPVGKCLRIKMLWDCTEWTEDYFHMVMKQEFSEEKAFVQDGSDYMAHLLTFGDFGCNQHEPEKSTL